MVGGREGEGVFRMMCKSECRGFKGTTGSKEGAIDIFWIELNIKSRNLFLEFLIELS